MAHSHPKMPYSSNTSKICVQVKTCYGEIFSSPITSVILSYILFILFFMAAGLAVNGIRPACRPMGPAPHTAGNADDCAAAAYVLVGALMRLADRRAFVA